MSTNRRTSELVKHVHIHSMLCDMVCYAGGHIYHSMWQLCGVMVHPWGYIHHHWRQYNGYMWLVVYLPVPTTHPPRITGDKIDSHSSWYGYTTRDLLVVKSRNCQVVGSALSTGHQPGTGQWTGIGVRDRNTHDTVITYLTLCGVCCANTWQFIYHHVWASHDKICAALWVSPVKSRDYISNIIWWCIQFDYTAI